MGYKHFGVKTTGIPVEYVELFVNEYGIKRFVETGTAGGQSVRAVAHLFNECHTIEIVEGRVMCEFPDNVTLHIGNSVDILFRIADKTPTVYWLDAHWSEPYESPEEVVECPILQELDAIKDCSGSVIMIDDARLFMGPPPWPCDPTRWPKLQHIFEKLLAYFPMNITTVVDDYIVSIPMHMRNTFYLEWRNRYKERYPEDSTRLKMSVQQTYKAFIDYVD